MLNLHRERKSGEAAPGLAPVAVITLALLLAAAPPASAQIERDATPGQTAEILTPELGVFTIDGQDGIRSAGDSAVVHSFTDFNVGAGQTARYTDDPNFINGVLNVITRVTGGNRSALDGRIESLYPNADFYFVNPSGIFFGSDFSIDVPQSFHFSTADVLEWDPGVLIETDLPSAVPDLIAAVPEAWGFLSAGPEKQITIDGFDAVRDPSAGGASFSFIGSSLVFGSTFTEVRTGGRDLTAIALGQAGSVLTPADPSAEVLATGDLIFNGNIDTRPAGLGDAGDVSLQGGAVTISTASFTTAGSTARGNAGNIEIIGNTISFGNSVILDTGAIQPAGTSGQANGGDILLFAFDSIDFDSGLAAFTSAVPTGSRSGNFAMIAASSSLSGIDLDVTAGASGFTNGATSGSIAISAGGILDIQGINLSAAAQDPGGAGAIQITAGQLTLANGNLAVTGDVAQNAGFINLTGLQFVDLQNINLDASTTGTGSGGNITVTTADFISDAATTVDVSSAGGTDGTFEVTLIGQSSEIVRDATPGQTEGPLMPDAGGVIQIFGEDGIRSRNNSAVVHSFSDFNIDVGQTALFTETNSDFLNIVQNVIARVTGGNRSDLDGTLASDYTNADLYFLNPNGVFFGSGFQIDVPASFLVATADRLEWDLGVEIDMGSPTAVPDLINTDSPEAFHFLSAGPEKQIIVNGFEAVTSVANFDDNDYVFAGADLIFGPDRIFTEGRTFIGVAAGQAGRFEDLIDPNNPVGPIPSGDILVLGDIDTRTNQSGGPQSGNIGLQGGAVTFVPGSQLITSGSAGVRDAGRVAIVANNLNFAGIIDAGTAAGSGGANGADVSLFAFDTANFAAGSEIFANAEAMEPGFASGDIEIIGRQGINATGLFAATGGAGTSANAGNVELVSDGSIDLDGVTLDARGSGEFGNVGEISIIGDSLTLSDSTLIASQSGDAGGTGFIDLTATDFLALENTALDVSNTGTSATSGGRIDVTAGSFTMDAASSADISSVTGADGEFNVTITGPPPVDPPDDPDVDLTETITEVIAGIEGLINLDAPDVALGSTGLGELAEFASTFPADADPESEDEEPEDAAAQLAKSSAAPPAVSSSVPTAEEALAADGSEPGASEEETEAAVESTRGEEKKRATRIPGVSLFTSTSESAPLVPRTCDALSGSGTASRLLAGRGRKQKASPEDWLLSFDRSGDSLLTGAVNGTPAAVGTLDTTPANLRSAGSHKALTAAAVAARGGRYEEAAAGFAAAVDEIEGAGDPSGASDALLAFAQLQLAEGRFDAARSSLERAVALAEQAEDPARVAAARASLGNALIGTGDLARAETEINRGLGFTLKSDDPGPGTAMLNTLGNQNIAKGDYKSALWAYQRAAELARDLGQVVDETRGLAGAARAAVDMRRLEEARGFLLRAGLLLELIDEPKLRVPLLIHIGRTHATLSQVSTERRSEALLNAHSALTAATESAQLLEDDEALARAQLNLASLYADEQHRSEALYLTRRARAAAERAESSELLYRAHWQEGRIQWAEHRIPEALSALRRAVALLEETRPVASAGYGASDARFRGAIGGVYRDTVDLLLRASDLATKEDAAERLVLEARDTLELLKGAELRDYFEDECIASVRGVGRELNALGPKAAVVYSVTLPDRLELLVALPSGVERYTAKASASRVNDTVDAFRRALQDPRSTAHRRPGRKLYDWIVSPYVKRLLDLGIETLVFVPDGRLRTVPFAALSDGSEYLGEQFATATTLSLRLLTAPELSSQPGRPLLAGISEGVQGFSALEAVDAELTEIQRIEGGELLLNQAFSLESIRSAVASEVPSIVHLATHAVFTGNPDTSFLLTYGDRVGFDDLSDVVGMTRADGAPLELLVLSACETAVGNDRAGLGFTGTAIRAGARSALGSLWPIADDAASELMIGFYTGLQTPGLSKARALQQAQAQLRSNEKFRHPFYWAPFTLVNDWL